MSQRFYGFTLTILFTSINLLSMDIYELNKRLNSLRNAQKNHSVLFKSPSSMPCFKQQSIVLHNNDASQYSLIFNRSQQPCITRYLLDGKSVAQLIQIDDEINFTTDNDKICTFSLQIPYQAGSLTINTQGRFIFEKKIDAYSAYITGKKIDFYDEFFSHNGLIVQADKCKSHNQLTCCDLLFKGKKFKIMPKSSLNMHNSLTVTAQSLVANAGIVDCKKESFITSSLFKNSGTFTSHNIHCEGNTINNEGTLTIGNTFHCASKLFNHSGKLDVSNSCIMEKGDVFSTTSSSDWNVKGDWKLFITSLDLKGFFAAKKLHCVGKTFIADASLRCIFDNAYLKIQEDMINAGVIKILGSLDVNSKNINLKETSFIIADNANLAVNETIHNEGIIEVKHHLSAHSRYISNAGKIEANSLDIKADRYFYNKIFSTLHAKNNLTIHTPLFLNLSGLTHAQNLTINSAIGLNILGIYAAKNMDFNSFASLNAGLFLPKFDTLAETCSWQNIWRLGESVFSTLFPVYGLKYTALKSIFTIFQQGKTLCSTVNSLYKKGNIEISNRIVLICLIKNIFSSAKQTYNLNKSHSLLSNSSTIEKPQNHDFPSEIAAQSINMVRQLPATLISLYAPNVNTDAIFDVNRGITIGINNHSSSFYNRNLNTSLYVNNTINTRNGENVGNLGAYNLNIKATNVYRSVGNEGNRAYINGNITAKNINIQSDNNISISSHLTSSNTHLYSREISQHGTITAEQVVMTGDIINNSGTVKAPKIIITQAYLPCISYLCIFRRTPSGFCNIGSLQASDQLFVDAANIKLHKKSNIDAQNACFQSNFNFHNDGQLKTEQCVINAQNQAINNGIINANELFQVKAHNIHFTNTSDITTKNTCFQSNSNFQNDGHLKTEQCVIDVQKQAINNGTINASELLQVKAQNIHLTNTSDIATKKAFFKTNSNATERSYFGLNSDWQNDGQLKAEQCVIDAQEQAINNGTINASELLQVKAQDIHFTNTSDITTKTAVFETNSDGTKPSRWRLKSNWQNDGHLKVEKCYMDVQEQAINNGIINASELLNVKAQNISFKQESNVKAKDAYYTADCNVRLDGVLDVEKGTIDAGGKVTAIGKIGASNQLEINAKDIVLEATSNVCTNDATLKAKQTIHNQGTLAASKLLAHAKYVENSGTINSDNAHIRADRCFWNQIGGSINVENNLNIDALVSLNTLGYIGADSLYTNSIIDVNLLGIYAGNNICQNSFFNYNAGILVPRLRSFDDLKKLLEKNKWRLAEGFVFQFLPRVGKIYSLSKMVVMCIIDKKDGLWGQGKSLIKDITDITDLYKKGDLCVSDALPVLFQTKNMFTTVAQTGHSAYQVGQQMAEEIKPSIKVEQPMVDAGKPTYQSIQNYLKGESCTINNSTQDQKATNEKTWPSFQEVMSFAGSQISAAASIAGPQLSRDSLLDVNGGLIFGVNGNYQSLYSANYGGSFFANNHFINTISGINTGIMSGGNIVVDAFSSYISDGITAAANISLLANDLVVAGKTYAYNNAFLKAHNSAVLDREITAHNVTVHAQDLLIKENALIVSRDKTNIIATQTVINKGTLNGKQIMVQGNEVILDNGSKIHTDGHVTVHAKNLLIEENSSIVSQDKMDVIATQKVVNKGTLDGKRIIVQGNEVILDDGSKIHTDGHVTVHAKNLLIEENSSIVSQDKMDVIATQKVVNKGTLDGKQIIVQGNEVILDNGSKIYANAQDGCAVINAEILHLNDDSLIDVNTATITAQSMRGEKGNTITSQNGTLIKTSQIDNHGTINGPVTLEFNGKAHKLESIGSVDHLMYSGTLENNIADKLANGHNTLLSVQKDGIVLINAQEQDVHLKEQHDISHTFHVQTNGSIQCDQDLFSEKSLWLQAQGDVHHASVRSKGTTALIGKNISSQGHVTRENSGENYTETCQESNVSGKNVIIHAQEDLQYKSTHVHSGIEGTQLFVGKKLIADALEVQEYSKTEENEFGKIRKKTIKLITTTENKTTTSVPCAFTSDGVTDGYVGNVAELHGTIFDSKGGGTIQVGSVEQVLTYDTHIQNKETKQQGINNVTTHTQSVSIKENPLEFRDEMPPVLISDNPVSLHIKCNAPSITINAPEVEINTTKQTTQVTSCKDGRYLGVWDRKTNTQSHDVITDPSYSGTINTNAQTIYIERSVGSAPPTINTTHENARITSPLIDHVHQHQKQSYNRPTPLAMSIIALSLSIALQGVGSSLGAGLVSQLQIESAVVAAMAKQAVCGTVNALCMETLTTLANCNGDLKKVAQELASKQTIRTIAITAIMAAATGGAHKLLDKVIPSPSQATTFGQCLASAATHELIGNGIRVGGDIAQGKDLQKAVKDRLKSVAANTLGVACSRQIGQAYGDGKIGSGTHKGLHTGLGALQGAILDGKNGAIAGAIGAGVAETIADVACPKPPSLDDISKIESQQGRQLTHDEFTAAWNQQLAQYLKQTHSIADASKMIAAAVAALAQQDINIAYDTAIKAVDNNFLILVGYGAVTAGVAYSAYQINNAYKEGGAQAALQRLGIEVVTQAAFGAATKIGFKVGCVMYPTAKAAIAVVLESMPGLKFALGGLADTLAVAGNKIASTRIGTAVKNLNQCVNQLETKIVTAENKIIDKVKNKIVDNVNKHLNPSFAEDLVEHVVPNSVISKMEAQVGKQVVENVETTIVQKLGNLTKPDLVMTTPEGVKISVPDTGEAGLLQRSDNVGESINERVKSPLTSNIETKSSSQSTKNATKLKDVVKIENKAIALSEPSIKTENIGVIKNDLRAKIKQYEWHIFSPDHETKGILSLGENREVIMDSLHDIIISLDKKGLLQEGSNQMRVAINGIDKVEIRCHIQNNEVISVNAFISDFSRIFNNFIDTTKVLK